MRPITLKAAPLLTLLASIALPACGTRGNLTQLPVPPQPPVLERWGPAPSTPPAAPPQAAAPETAAMPQGAGDLNMAAEPAK